MMLVIVVTRTDAHSSRSHVGKIRIRLRVRTVRQNVEDAQPNHGF